MLTGHLPVTSTYIEGTLLERLYPDAVSCQLYQSRMKVTVVIALGRAPYATPGYPTLPDWLSRAPLLGLGVPDWPPVVLLRKRTHEENLVV